MIAGTKRINFLIKESVFSKKHLAFLGVFLVTGFAASLQWSFQKIEGETLPIAKIIPKQTESQKSAETDKSPIFEMLTSRLSRIPGVEKFQSSSSSGELAVELKSDDFFKIGTATLEDRSITAIREVALLLKETFASSWIEIEGHTDDSPVVKQRRFFPSNWELSAARAASLLHVFEEAGFQKHHLKVAGYGDSRPVGGSQAGNRRIVVRVIHPNEEGGR
jgi:chemotaxis protein MotB